jgi:hypothetical protein
MQNENTFWRYWIGGLLLLAFMAALNPFLANATAPWAILDHQVAGSAARVDAIQQAWARDGVLNLARFSMAVDLLFIPVYSWGAYCGGRVMRGETNPKLRRVGWLVMVAASLYPFLDYTETICQFIQAMQFQGNDSLAEIAATVKPVKSVVFLITLFGLLAALAVRRFGNTNGKAKS